jgi:hypothetical protein
MKTKFYYYQDPGHGWVAVPVSLLEQLNIVGKISAFSYFRGRTAYLEEDCDLALFFEAYRAEFGVDPVLISKHTDKRSPIRSYARFTYSPAVRRQKILEALVEAGYLQFLTVNLKEDAA